MFLGRTRIRILSAAVLIVAALAGETVQAQAPPPDPANTVPQTPVITPAHATAEAQNPSPTNSSTLEGGYLINFKDSPANSFYYKFTYNGSLLGHQGQPFSLHNVGQTNIQAPTLDNTSGDTSQLHFRLERGQGSFRGGIFDGLGLQPFRIGGLQELRGALQLNGRLDGKQYNIAAGFETAPFHPLHWYNRLAHAGITNWVIFGAMGQYEDRSSDNGASQTTNILTYRAFLGRGWGWVPSRKLAQTVADLKKYLYAKADAAPNTGEFKTYMVNAAAVLMATQKPGSATLSRNDMVFVDLVLRAKYLEAHPPKTGPVAFPDKTGWTKFVDEYAAPSVRFSSDRPTAALWADSSAWYDLTGRIDSTTSPSRFNNLIGISLRLWIDPRGDQERWIQLRYENGRERSAPTVNLNTFFITTGINF